MSDNLSGDCGDVVAALHSDGLPYFYRQRYMLGYPDPVEVPEQLKLPGWQQMARMLDAEYAADPGSYTATATATA